MLSLLELPRYLIQLLSKLCDLDINLKIPDLLADLKKFHDVARVSLDSLDSHVIVHAFLHESSVREGLGIVRDVKGM